MNKPDVNSSVNAIIDRLKAVADPIAVLAGESYGEVLDEAVKALYELRVHIEDEYAKLDAQINELHNDLVWHLKERTEAVAILENKIRRLERELLEAKKDEAQETKTEAAPMDEVHASSVSRWRYEHGKD